MYYLQSQFNLLLLLGFFFYQGNQEADDIHYAALNVSLPNRTRRQRNSTNTKNECVYASVKQN